MQSYAARSPGTSYSPGFDHLNAATLQMQSQTILTAAAMENVCALTAIGDRLSALVPGAAPRLNYLIDRATMEFGNTISGFRF